MGGGAVMRAAAKVAGTTFFTGGFRSRIGTTSETLSSARNSVRASISASTSSDTLSLDLDRQCYPTIQKPVWEIDGWDFADDVEYEDGKYGRLVFGPVPSLEEAKEATFQLKDALDKVYLSSPKTPESMDSVQETKACITQDSTVPKPAVQAFKLLNESPAAQTVVASIACDPNVWNAVMQNPTLVEFLEADRKCASFDVYDSLTSSTGSTHFEEPEKPDGLMAIFEDVKRSVSDMVNNLSNFVQSLFPDPGVGNKAESLEGMGRSLFAGGSFMALAMMVIMVVVMKRG